MPEPSRAALGRREVLALDDLECRLSNRHHHELGDPVPAFHLVVGDRVGVDQEDRELTAVPRVDEPRGVEAGDPVVEGETAARQDEAAIADGQGDDDPGRNEGPATPGAQTGVFAGIEIGPGVARVGVVGHGQPGVQLMNRDRNHAGGEVTDSGRPRPEGDPMAPPR